MLHASLWRVPPEEAAALLPRGFAGGELFAEPLRLGRSALLVTGWASYAPGGVLAYEEALCAVVLRGVLRPSVCILRIWVDHPASQAGGRALWAIPKEMGRFSGTPDAPEGARLTLGEGGLSADPAMAFAFSPGLQVPGWRHFRLQTVQHSEGRLVKARLQTLGRLTLGRGRWRFDPDGPLGFLAGRTPWISARLDRAAISFGI